MLELRNLWEDPIWKTLEDAKGRFWKLVKQINWWKIFMENVASNKFFHVLINYIFSISSYKNQPNSFRPKIRILWKLRQA